MSEANTKHTPGPWAAGEDWANPAVVAEDGERVIAYVPYAYETEGWTPEDEANMNLLIAAPELLDALDACETALAPVMADHSCGDSPSEGKRCGECLGCARWAAWQMAEAALKKARGEG